MGQEGGKRRLIGGTYVAERRAARVILLIRLEMGQVGQRSRVPYGNLLPRWLRARIYAARQITISETMGRQRTPFQPCQPSPTYSPTVSPRDNSR